MQDPASSSTTPGVQRLRVVVRGAVQGVGFRPFVYRLASELGLTGWVQNSQRGVYIELEGASEALDWFVLRLDRDKPSRAVFHCFESSILDPVGYAAFDIRESDDQGDVSTLILADIATCDDCLHEIFDPAQRRYRYPFTNCTNCGPRFTILESLPYDRPNTSMKRFTMCEACELEYTEPRDRRFHAQPIACPECGPQLQLWEPGGAVSASGDDALRDAAEAVRAGRILALKGLGGFQLIVDARDDAAVRRLRDRKHRSEKPLAVMYPSLQSLKNECSVSTLEERLLLAPEAPIVLLDRTDDTLSPWVAPGNPQLGAMLPYTPLHHLLMHELGFPVVATSGNLSDEPMCIEEYEALDRLGGIADVFLVHDRRIVRHVDDSITRVILGREQVLRRARGYAPLPIHLSDPLPRVLGVGAHLKSSVALSYDNDVFISQHLGDLETVQALDAFHAIVADLQGLFCTPRAVANDLHPDYASTKHAENMGLPLVQVQHHYAHVVSCMAENALEPPVLGVAWDGTGLGGDGTIWGGEFLLVTGDSFERVGHLRPFRLPGGDAAIRNPRRSALGVLYELFGEEAFGPQDPLALRQMLVKGVNSPFCSSAGRLFDAVASILDLRQSVSFEGQAAMDVEFAADPAIGDAYPIGVGEAVDWGPTIEAMRADKSPRGVRAARFHNALVEAIVRVARRVGESKVVLTGGCFQNRYLAERTVIRLREEGFHPYWHQRVPPNDGGIALGQVVAAAWSARDSAAESGSSGVLLGAGAPASNGLNKE